MLPRLDGMEMCRQLRAKGFTTPILFLTARTSIQDKVLGFDNGADDYLTKPFAFAESHISGLPNRGKTVAFFLGFVSVWPNKILWSHFCES